MRLKTFKAEQQNTNEHGKTEMKLNQRGKKRIDKHIHTLILVPSFFTVYCRCVCVCLSELASSPLPSLSLCMYVCMFILQCIGQCKVMKCGTTSLHFLLFIYIYIYIFKYSPFLYSSTVHFCSVQFSSFLYSKCWPFLAHIQSVPVSMSPRQHLIPNPTPTNVPKNAPPFTISFAVI